MSPRRLSGRRECFRGLKGKSKFLMPFVIPRGQVLENSQRLTAVKIAATISQVRA